jgi:hypothetical protein
MSSIPGGSTRAYLKCPGLLYLHHQSAALTSPGPIRLAQRMQRSFLKELTADSPSVASGAPSDELSVAANRHPRVVENDRAQNRRIMWYESNDQ